MSLEYYDNFVDKVHSAPPWNDKSEQILVEPYSYLSKAPGKEVRSALIAAFNTWMNVPEEDLSIVKKVVGMLHTASLLMDDVEDDSHLRRGQPGTSNGLAPGRVESAGKELIETDAGWIWLSVAHKIYGVPQTINSANYVYFLAYQELQRIHPFRPDYKIEEAVTQELLNLHRGQGMDLYWRENLVCPTEPEYIEMVNNKTGGLFRIAIKLMMAASPEKPARNYVPLANLIGIIFQIRDDYVNLQSAQVSPTPSPSPSPSPLTPTHPFPKKYATNKGYCEDFSEGKFSFPIVHSIRADTSNREILNILRQRPTSPSPKTYAVEYMEKQTNSFEYTRNVLGKLLKQAREEVARLGGNKGVERILDQLEVKEKEGVTGEVGEEKR